METTEKHKEEKITCPKCGNKRMRNGVKNGVQQWTCTYCNPRKRRIKSQVQEINHTIKRKNMGISEEQLRMKHDVKYQIRKAVESLKKGEFLAQSEFVIHAGIKAGAGYRDIMEHPNFAQYRGKAGGTIYWGHPDSIKEMKADNVLT